MKVKNSEATRKVKAVVASMAIEEMYFDKEFVSELIAVEEKKKTSEELIREVIEKYAR